MATEKDIFETFAKLVSYAIANLMMQLRRLKKLP